MSARNRFYEAVLVLHALTACTLQRPPPAADSVSDARQNQESHLHDFVNKLSQICDNEKCGGATVSAFVLLQPGSGHPIEYRFASNQRKAAQLENTKLFIVRVLETLRRSNEANYRNDSRPDVLRLILLYNRSRVTAYLTSMAKQCDECISKLRPEEESKHCAAFLCCNKTR